MYIFYCIICKTINPLFTIHEEKKIPSIFITSYK